MQILLLLSLMIVCTSCRSLPAPVLITETKGGEKMTMQEVEKTGDRNNVPAGEKAANVVSMTTFSHAGGHIAKVTTMKNRWNPFAKPKVYFNCIDCHTQSPESLGVKVERPKDPWWKFPLFILIAVGIAAMLLSWGKIKALMSPFSGVIGLITRIWKK